MEHNNIVRTIKLESYY